jgi:imidazolonepropionase-like amidohydrolase
MGRIVLREASVWDAVEGRRDECTVVVDGDRIDAILPPATEVATGHDDRVIDLAGRTVLPGMVTSHFHASYHELGARPGPFGLEEPPALQAVRAVNSLGLAVRSGFTGAISAGAPHGIDAAMKLAIAEGAIVGPRLVTGSHDLSSTGHANDASFPWYWDVRARGALRCCDGPEEYRKAVREEAKAGAEMIKLFVTGGHGTTQPRERLEIAPDELRVAIETAHERGVRIRGHIANKEALLLAVGFGIDIVDHGDGLDAECIDRLVETGTALVPSQLFPARLYELMGARFGFTDAMKRDIDAGLAVLRSAQDAGVKLLIGDDYGAMGFPHGAYADELDFYVREAGMSPAEVLGWATVNGAEALGHPGDLGLVAEGRLADLVIVDGDPLADVGILRDPARILAVLKGGAFVKDQLAVAPALANA